MVSILTMLLACGIFGYIINTMSTIIEDQQIY